MNDIKTRIEKLLHLTIQEVYDQPVSVAAEELRLYTAMRVAENTSNIGALVVKVRKNLLRHPEFMEESLLLKSFVGDEIITSDTVSSYARPGREFYSMLDSLKLELTTE